MRKRVSFSESSRIAFNRQTIVHADDFESCVVNFYQKASDVSIPLLIDFMDTTYIDVPVLVNFIEMYVTRQKIKAETYLGMSKDKAVRDFMRVWRFPEAFVDATDVPFENILVEEDQKYRGEQQDTYRGIGNGINALEFNPDWRKEYPGRRNFFEFSTYHFSDAENALHTAVAIPRLEGAHWNEPLIRQVLRTHLQGDTPKDDVARVVVYESLSNAVRHPNARHIQAVSRFERIVDKTPRLLQSEKGARIGHLHICVWDDGDSIVNTLRPLVNNGLPIRSMKMPAYMYDKIYVQIRPFGGKFGGGFIVDQETDPTPKSDDSIILLASFYPGVSRAISMEVKDVENFDGEKDEGASIPKPLERKAGMGLYALMRTALDFYRGSIIVRSGDLLMLLEPAHDTFRVQHGTRYKAKITQFPKSNPLYQGNLLIIQLPVRR
jgi:hypothetical protein